jgi:hypothetical protein
VRDLKGNLLSDKMVGHIFQVEDGLVKRFDIGGSGENRGQSTRDLGRLFSPRAARLIVSGYGSHAQKDFAPEPSLRLSGKKAHRVLPIVRQLSETRHLGCAKRVREFWNQSHCSLAIKVLRVY